MPPESVTKFVVPSPKAALALVMRTRTTLSVPTRRLLEDDVGGSALAADVDAGCRCPERGGTGRPEGVSVSRAELLADRPHRRVDRDAERPGEERRRDGRLELSGDARVGDDEDAVPVRDGDDAGEVEMHVARGDPDRLRRERAGRRLRAQRAGDLLELEVAPERHAADGDPEALGLDAHASARGSRGDVDGAGVVLISSVNVPGSIVTPGRSSPPSVAVSDATTPAGRW